MRSESSKDDELTRKNDEPASLEIRRVSPEWEGPLQAFFRVLTDEGVSKYFHPHAFDDNEAHRRATYQGVDLYYMLVEGHRVLGYGMLSGWDEGFEVPSLGIVIHPAVRGSGFGRMLMLFLHSAALRKGAARIRLKVYPENSTAASLYESLGYKFTERDGEQLVGFKELQTANRSEREAQGNEG